MRILIETSDYTTAQWQQMYDEAGTVAELARRMERSVEVIRYHLKRADVTINPNPVLPTRINEYLNFTRDEWQRMYDDAGTMKELARRLEQPLATVRWNAVRAGITPRRSGFKVPNRKSAGKGPDHHNWKGGSYTDRYVWEYAPDHPQAKCRKGYVAQHRLVMERYLGRFLEPHEHIHHKDGDKQNNDLSNLELITHPEHMSLHANVKPRDDRGRFSK